MSFTVRTVTHTYLNADSTPASGKVTFDLAGAMTNGGTTILPSEVVAPLDSTGSFSVSLAGNDDTATVPTGVQWQATVRVLGSEPSTSSITIPSAGTGNVDLGTLLPSAHQVN